MFPPELPPVSNKALYVYRILMKWLSFFIFGFSSLILGIIIFPPLRLVLRSREQFKRYGRRFVSFYMNVFVSFMHIVGIVNLEAGSREPYLHLSSKIIVANHPSLLDIVMLLSLIPNADCIVNARLALNIIGVVIRQLYILNSLEFDDLLRASSESLDQGNCLIIFPEGTRTPRSEKIILKKGAARISLFCNCGIIPLHIGGTDKFGLGKRDPWTGFNPRERYVYRISMGEEIHPEKYLSLSSPAAVKTMTKELSAFLFPEY